MIYELNTWRTFGRSLFLKTVSSSLLVVTSLASAADAPPCIDKKVQAMVLSTVGDGMVKMLGGTYKKEHLQFSLELAVPTEYNETIKKRGCSANIIFQTYSGVMPALRKQVAIFTPPGVIHRATTLRSLARNDPAEADILLRHLQVLDTFKDAPFMAAPDGGTITQNMKYSVQLSEDGKNNIVTVTSFSGDVSSFFNVLKSCEELNNVSAKARALLLP